MLADPPVNARRYPIVDEQAGCTVVVRQERVGAHMADALLRMIGEKKIDNALDCVLVAGVSCRVDAFKFTSEGRG